MYRINFRINFNGDELFILTPWFGFSVGFGAKEWDRYCYYWGWKVYWSRNDGRREGDWFFKRYYEFNFRQQSYMDYVIKGSKVL